MDALEFDQGDDDMHGDELGRNPAEAESYFSSRIHSSSETFSSEMMLAYQQALRMNGGALSQCLATTRIENNKTTSAPVRRGRPRQIGTQSGEPD